MSSPEVQEDPPPVLLRSYAEATQRKQILQKLERDGMKSGNEEGSEEIRRLDSGRNFEEVSPVRENEGIRRLGSERNVDEVSPVRGNEEKQIVDVGSVNQKEEGEINEWQTGGRWGKWK
ncbi:hypothetical protein DY000_02041016 [Brassica cretica]|uniref:Uncharacterized protein n=1 Tax=Brassica cretica TaxID=69181 RepID=A0ABQ7BNF7_BRACR|nr:hypothetical protein DY000_02041016 [Brassica cretica]